MNEQTNQKINLDPNIEAVISYIPFIGSIVMYLFEKENKFVRFHAVQAFLFWLVVLAANGILTSLKVILIGFLLDPFFQVAIVALWFFLMYKAYKNEEYELPFLGKIAKEQANK